MADPPAQTLPLDWYVETHQPGVDPDKKYGLYEWRIQGVGSYIGKYTHLKRPTREYTRNVQKLLEGRPYRRGNPDGFRNIHRALYEAVLSQRRIELIILENVERDRINAREMELIAERGQLNQPSFGRRV